MTGPESLILQRLLDRLERLGASTAIDVGLLGPMPADVAAFEAMPPERGSAARALLKSFEQSQDQLSRVFRLVPTLLAEDTERWFARDYADYMERLGILDAARDWSRVGKLRNQLVHDYPLDAEVQFSRLLEAASYLPLLEDIRTRLAVFARDVLPGKMP